MRKTKKTKILRKLRGGSLKNLKPAKNLSKVCKNKCDAKCWKECKNKYKYYDECKNTWPPNLSCITHIPCLVCLEKAKIEMNKN